MLFGALILAGVQSAFTVGATTYGLSKVVGMWFSNGYVTESTLLCIRHTAATKAKWPAFEADWEEALGDDQSSLVSLEMPHEAGTWMVTHSEAGILSLALASAGLLHPETVACVRVIRNRARFREQQLLMARWAVAQETGKWPEAKE